MCRAGCAFVALLLMAASVGKAQEPVDIELALAVDVSISVDGAELALLALSCCLLRFGIAARQE